MEIRHVTIVKHILSHTHVLYLYDKKSHFFELQIFVFSLFFAVYPSNHVNSICSMWGNFHFKTFDGDVYQFPGMCEYNLVSDCQSLIRQFSVHVRRTEDTNDPKISRVSVSINDIIIELTEKEVMINEQK